MVGRLVLGRGKGGLCLSYIGWKAKAKARGRSVVPSPAPSLLVHGSRSWSSMLGAAVVSEMGVSLAHGPAPEALCVC